MQFTYFDIHSHLNLTPLLENKDEIINTMRQQGMGTITVGVDYETSKMAVEMALKYENLYACIGLHPADNATEIFDYNKYLELVKHDKVVAIGETGLDYFRDQSVENKQRQKELFIKHIQLAVETGKPLMIHARPSKDSMPARNASGTADAGGNAYEDVLDILETENFIGQVNFHFFVGDIEIAKRIVGKGWTMSFDGPITFTNDYDDVIKFIPLENIMAETDAPFATPMPHRGQTNYPQHVEFVYKKIAQIKGLDPEIVRNTILNNVKRVFGVSIDE